MEKIQLHHITLTEDVREHELRGNFYKVVHRGRIVPHPENDGSVADSSLMEKEVYEVVEVRNYETRKVEYFGINTAQRGILEALLGYTDKHIAEMVEGALANERRFSAWRMNQELGKQRNAIKNLSWYKRLFNKF